VPAGIAFPGVGVGALYLAPEFLVAGAVFFLLSGAVFLTLARGETAPGKRCILEPAIAFLGISLGVALEFPAVLNNPLFVFFHDQTLWSAYLLLGVLLILCTFIRYGLLQPRAMVARGFLANAVFVAFGWVLTQLPVPPYGSIVNQGSTVILGIDSLGLHMEIDALRDFSREHGGAFYERAVTPGLLTNAVWTAILQHRPIHDTGTFFIFQSPDWSRSPFNLIREARSQGFQTWSFFTGQHTIYVGSLAGFDHDRSGAMGWLQNATASAKNGSVLLPFLISRLPQLPFSQAPANQSATYAFDLHAVVRSILTAHQGSKPVFAVAHLGYLHDEAYPRFDDLSPGDRSLVLSARVDSLRDFGGEWQLPIVPGDAINLNAWKIQNVQKVVIEEIRKSGFLAPENRNRLLLFSDHGKRTLLNNDNFHRPVFWEIPLITFGMPVRELQQPISLMDIPSLIGLDDPSLPGPAAPVVEYVNMRSLDEFRSAVLGAEWLADGRINIRPDVSQRFLSLLRSHHPFAAPEVVRSATAPGQVVGSRPSGSP
jgi:hypothetical protein